MGILVSNNTKEILINVVIYLVLFNIMYSMLLSGAKYRSNVSLYVITMEIKFLITYGSTIHVIAIMSLYRFFASLIVYTILGLIIVKILDEMVNYHSRISFVVLSIALAFAGEFLLGSILYAILDIITLFLIIFLKTMVKAIFSWF